MSKKILHVITSLRTGGAEKLMIDLLPSLCHRGFEVEILLFDGVDTPFKQILQKRGINILDFGINNSVYSLKNVVKLRKLIANYDVIHTHNTAAQLYTAFAGIGKKIKLVTTEHNTDNRRRHFPGWILLDRWMYNQYNHVICISDKAEENLKAYLKKFRTEVSTIYNGINIYNFTSAKPIDFLSGHIPDKAIIITMVAAFRPQKDQDTLIQAMNLLPKNYHLIFVGTGERLDYCKRLANQSDAKDRIHFWGHRNNIAEILKASDLIVLSSHYEGLSLSSVEGMSVGKPFIASDVDGLREVVKGAGILFPHANSEALADVILRLEANPQEYKEVSDACLKRAKQYDISKMVEGYVSVYNRLIP